MRHKIETIAKNHLVNPLFLIRFAAENQKKYGVFLENGHYNTTTWFVNDLIKDFKALDDNNRIKLPFLRAVDLQGMIVQGWTAEIESPQSGALVWTNEEHPETRIYGTPNWDEDGRTPFEIHEDHLENGGIHVIEIKLEKECPLEYQQNLYISVIRTLIHQITSKDKPKF